MNEYLSFSLDNTSLLLIFICFSKSVNFYRQHNLVESKVTLYLSGSVSAAFNLHSGGIK